ncbi:hypothetical protein FZZ93_05770 [Halomonas eurihalina]|uniref:Uncharacterized protein n=1 Tax=Halomonas eurihalina TaxID=42566 RepID=A0A5D9DBE9_HALER|nr:hypothetical protein [Halomonas eurihalina]MDR5859408.1 hypothetical protein [Halomonas eurihalina]TZG40552.1 hypothetical protein FZZ93_05770 [Halomonas eurihalina]
MKLRVTKPNLYRNSRRCHIGEQFSVEGDTIPTLYKGKVEVVPEPVMEVATPDAQANDTGNQGNGDTGAEADEQRRQWLLNQIEELTGKRPGSNSKIETLEAKFEEAKLAAEKE